MLGIVIAIMRLSHNPVLRGVAWVYTWFFRAVPRLVLAILFGNLGILWARIEFGLPFDRQIGAPVRRRRLRGTAVRRSARWTS